LGAALIWKTVTASKPALLRQLGLVSATALVISNMIGSAIFTSSGFFAGDLGSPSLLMWLWVVGAVCAILGAICYSELGINFPSSGGEYVYLTRAFGPTWGFVTGWVSFFAGFSAPIATAALAFAEYIGYFFPAVKQENSHVILGSGDWTLQIGLAPAVASLLVIAFTILNVFGVQRVARIQNTLTAIKVLVLVAFIVLAFTVGNGRWENFSMNAVRTSEMPLPAQFGVSLMFVYLSYSGWNAATYVAEEIRKPSRTLPIALGLGTLLVTVLYLALNVVFIYAAPLEDLKGKVAVGSFAASRLFGPEVTGVFSALMALSLMSTVNAMVTIGPRVYYAMAGNGAFLSAAARVHPRYHTPVAAIIAQGVCTIAMTLTSFRQLVEYIGFTLNFFAVMSVVALMTFRKRPGWQKLPVVSFLYPLFPSLFVLAGLWVTYQGFARRPYVALAAVITVVTGAAVYHLRLKSRAPGSPAIETY
jgi:basic amino acid/polyamine antiporter, APA family